MGTYQDSKKLVLRYFEDMESAAPESVGQVVERYAGDGYLWRGVYPFRELHGVEAAVETFWQPLMQSVRHMQRRQDVFNRTVC